MSEIYNAKIKFTWLGFEESGKLMFQIGFDSEKGTFTTTKKIGSMGRIEKLLFTLGVSNYEELSRKFARIEVDNKTVIAIGNIIESKWMSWEE